MMDFFILTCLLLVGLAIFIVLIIELARIIFRPSLNALWLKFRSEIIRRNRIKARGFLYSNTQKKDCWI